MSSTFVIAWRNLGRNRRRTALALAAIAIAQVSVLAIDGLMHGFVDSTLDSLTGPLMGHVQIHAPDFREERAPDLVIDDVDMRLTAVRRVQGVASAHARIYAPALAAQDVEGFAVVAVGVDFEAERAHGGLLEGLRGQTPGDREALIGEQLARQQGIEVGDELALVGTATDGSIANDLVRVAGILETPMEMISRSGVVMQLESAQEIFAMPDMAHEITVRGTGAPADAPALAARIRRAPTMGGLEVLPWMELAPELASFFSIAGLYGYFVMLIVFLAAAAGVANTMLMATFERRRELGMLLSLGTSPGRLVRIILIEAVLLGLFGVFIGCVIGGTIVAIQGAVGINPWASGDANVAIYGVSFNEAMYPRLLWSDYVPGFIGVSVVSILAALLPAIHAARLEPVEAMRR